MADKIRVMSDAIRGEPTMQHDARLKVIREELEGVCDNHLNAGYEWD